MVADNHQVKEKLNNKLILNTNNTQKQAAHYISVEKFARKAPSAAAVACARCATYATTGATTYQKRDSSISRTVSREKLVACGL